MMTFYKYHATGNDFILLDRVPEDPSSLAKHICDRHVGIGADGLLYAQASEHADVSMHYHNADGSRAKMCGNGLRCFVRFLLDQNQLKGEHFTVETDAGVIAVELIDQEIALHLPMDDQAITPQECTEPLLDHSSLLIDQQRYTLQRLGTLHAITQVKDFSHIDALGPMITTHRFFPDHINTNFVQVIDATQLFVRTHERGAGWTLSCGTGVAASALVAHRLGVCSNQVNVTVLGGQLKVSIQANEVILQGPAVFIALGKFQEKRV